MASENNLHALFHETLKDIYFAEEMIVSTLPKMAKAAQSADLKAALEKHETETEEHFARLEKVIAAIDETPRGKTCDAIMGIIEQGQEVPKEFKGASALDAGLLPALRRSSTMRMRTLKTWAAELGLRKQPSPRKRRLTIPSRNWRRAKLTSMLWPRDGTGLVSTAGKPRELKRGFFLSSKDQRGGAIWNETIE